MRKPIILPLVLQFKQFAFYIFFSIKNQTQTSKQKLKSLEE